LRSICKNEAGRSRCNRLTGSPDITTDSGAAGQGISFSIIPMCFKKLSWENDFLIRPAAME
jgi:hypothetical protein